MRIFLPILAHIRPIIKAKAAHHAIPAYGPQAIKATQSPRGPVIRACQPSSGGLHGAEPSFDPALLPTADNRPGFACGGPPSRRHLATPLCQQQNSPLRRAGNRMRVRITGQSGGENPCIFLPAVVSLPHLQRGLRLVSLRLRLRLFQGFGAAKYIAHMQG